MFTTRLAQLASSSVDFRYRVTAFQILTNGKRVTGVRTSQGDIDADLVLVALGSYSPFLLRSLELHLPVYPVKGYSLTAPITNEAGAPVSTVMDETYKVAITRLGNRIRVGGTAEISGFDLTLRQSRRGPLEHSARDLFGNGACFSEASFWCGLRPMTPDGPPVIGGTSIPGLYLNTGHGTLGWTMACGSGQLIADLISGQLPEISPECFKVDRYRPSRN